MILSLPMAYYINKNERDQYRKTPSTILVCKSTEKIIPYTDFQFFDFHRRVWLLGLEKMSE